MKKVLFLTVAVCVLSVSAFAKGGIRDVDFKNFTYTPAFCGMTYDENGDETDEKREITVEDGEFSEEREIGEGEDAFTERMYFSITDVAYGDLDGDKAEEAFVISVCNTGGTGNFSEGYIYKMVEDEAQLIYTVGGGDRADGGFKGAKIEKGFLIIESYGTGEFGGACCPEEIITNKYKWDTEELVEVGESTKRELYPATRVTFDKGKSSKTIAVKLTEDQSLVRYVVKASAGQILTVTTNNKDVSINLRKGEAEVNEDGNKLVAILSESGDFVIEFFASSENGASFNATIAIKTPPK